MSTLNMPIHKKNNSDVNRSFSGMKGLPYRAQAGDRFARIAKLEEVIFHTKDLANIWNIDNRNTLYTALKRYVQRGLLFRIYKGFYAIKPVEQLDVFLLGARALHQYAYVSTESVLSQEGIIQQEIERITFISAQSGKFTIPGVKRQYYSRKLAEKYLYHTSGIIEQKGVKFATVSRAVADLLYFNRKVYFDGEALIDWKEVRDIQRQVGYPLTPKRYPANPVPKKSGRRAGFRPDSLFAREKNSGAS